MRNSGTLLLALSTLVLLGTSELLAQRGQGRVGGAGTGNTLSSAAGKPDVSEHGSAGRTNAGLDHSAHASQASVSERLTDNTKLSGRLQSLLPAGTNVQTAGAGFKNLGQFVAAVHVSHNLNIPFDELKARVTGPRAESLGKAIEQLRPDLDKKTVRDDVKDARRQAGDDTTEK